MRTLLDVMLDAIYDANFAAKCGDRERVNAIIEGLTDIVAVPYDNREAGVEYRMDDLFVPEEETND